MKENGKLFSIGQVCTATGLSRTALIKLEQEGLLTPARHDAEGCKRFYSVENIERIFRVRSIQRCGFSHAEIGRLMGETNDYSNMILHLEERRRDLDRTLRCLRIMSGQEQLLKAEKIDIPMMYCYTAKYSEEDFCPTAPELMERTLMEAVHAGTCVDYLTPWHFRLPTKDVMNGIRSEKTEITCCIPLKEAVDDPRVVRIDAYQALMISLRGSMSEALPGLRLLKKKIREERYIPADYCALIPLVNAMTDPGLREEDTVIEILIPVRSAED